MEKVALKRSPLGKLRHFKRLAKTSPRATGSIVGGVLGGGSANFSAKKENEKIDDLHHKGKGKNLKKRDRTADTILGAIGGSALGYSFGDIKSKKHEFNKWRRAYKGYIPKEKSKPPKTPEWAKKVKTKDEAKKAFRAEAMKHHPDRGGDPEKMKTLNVEWEDFKNHEDSPFHKLSSVLDSFLVELFRIYSE